MTERVLKGLGIGKRLTAPGKYRKNKVRGLENMTVTGSAVLLEQLLEAEQVTQECAAACLLALMFLAGMFLAFMFWRCLK